nr:hypothetical protein [Corynebacterium lactis]
MRHVTALSPLSTRSSHNALGRTALARAARGALTFGAVGLLSVGALTACSPSNEKDSAQSPTASSAASAPVTSIEQAATESEGPAIPYTKTDGNLKITVHDLLKPGAEIMISSPCGGSDTHAKLTTSLDKKVVDMSPAADMGELIGYITAPDQIGVAPPTATTPRPSRVTPARPGPSPSTPAETATTPRSSAPEYRRRIH